VNGHDRIWKFPYRAKQVLLLASLQTSATQLQLSFILVAFEQIFVLGETIASGFLQLEDQKRIWPHWPPRTWRELDVHD
jgi:hypothetical protein